MRIANLDEVPAGTVFEVWLMMYVMSTTNPSLTVNTYFVSDTKLVDTSTATVNPVLTINSVQALNLF